LNVTLHPCLI